MKRILAVALIAMMAFVAVAAADEAKKEEAAKPTTLTGEVIDLSCYMDHGASGMDHAKCAQGCIKKGMPVGFLTADGTMYVILGANHEPANAQVADYAGKKSMVTGTVKEEKGLKTIMLASIADAK
jgi:hypothetical protein